VIDSEVELEAYYREFAEAVGSDGELPTTSSATPEQFAAEYEPRLASGRDVVSIHISSGVSDTCGAARNASPLPRWPAVRVGWSTGVYATTVILWCSAETRI
jgi:fatty acid-binding protein DegV